MKILYYLNGIAHLIVSIAFLASCFYSLKHGNSTRAHHFVKWLPFAGVALTVIALQLTHKVYPQMSLLPFTFTFTAWAVMAYVNNKKVED